MCSSDLFDDITQGDPACAGAARRRLHVAVGDYDLRVLEALDRIIDAGIDGVGVASDRGVEPSRPALV